MRSGLTDYQAWYRDQRSKGTLSATLKRLIICRLKGEDLLLLKKDIPGGLGGRPGSSGPNAAAPLTCYVAVRIISLQAGDAGAVHALLQVVQLLAELLDVAVLAVHLHLQLREPHGLVGQLLGREKRAEQRSNA